MPQIESECRYYFSHKLNMAFFYRDTKSIARQSAYLSVECPIIGQRVWLKYMGSDSFGFDRTMQVKPENGYIYPVDLHSSPHTLNPKPSRACTTEMVEEFTRIARLRAC